jgi:F-type H+-transporting ATPase subunit gamma
MPATREIRRRIRSVRSTRQITKAMELVAASKMRRATESTLNSRPYARRTWEILNDLTGSFQLTEDIRHPLLENRPVQRELAVVIGSDRGLAGAFTTNLLRQCLALSRQPHPVDFITMGKKIEHALSLFGLPLIQSYPHTPTHPTTEDIIPITSFCLRSFQTGQYDRVSIVFTEYYSLLRQEVLVRQLLPLLPDARDVEDAAPPNPPVAEEPAGHPSRLRPGAPGGRYFLYEPDINQVLDTLLPRFVEVHVYQALLESLASEHSSRRMAMKSATDNASGMLDDLTLTYNSLRQAAITNEIAEITGGAAALTET